MRFSSGQRNVSFVTYSGLERSLIKLPKTPNLEYLEHWDKSFGLLVLSKQVAQVIDYKLAA